MRGSARKIHAGSGRNYLLPMAIFAASLCLATSAGATETPTTQQAFETAFQQMMRDPGDVDATMHYANLAIAMQNYEAAIPALERILFFNPKLHDVKLELGVLYYNLHSYDVAREYFTAAKAAGATNDITQQADDYLAKLEKAGG